MAKTLLQTTYDFVGIPLRLVLLPDEANEKLHLTSLVQERICAIIPYIRGKLLDIGCGNNRLVHTYGNGIGVDVYDWGGGAQIVEDPSRLPFGDDAFDTVTLVASLNHIPDRDGVIHEARRLVKADGRLIVTMIDPILGYIGHKIWWYSEDKERGMEEGEKDGLWNRDIIALCKRHAFRLTEHKRFVYYLNNLLVFEA